MLRSVALVLFVFLLAGCSGTKHLGRVGQVDFYSVHAEHFTGPNFTSLVTETGGKDIEGEDGEMIHVSGQVRIEKTAFGPGIGPSLVHGVSKIAADVGAASMYGHSLKFPDHEGDEIHVEGGDGSSSSKSSSKSKGGGKGGGGGGGGGGEKPEKGNNGKGNGEDPQPPGDPKKND